MLMRISEDKRTITLDVPLGNNIYGIITSCNDACTFQKEDFKKAFPNYHCSGDLPCHTKIHSIKETPLTLANLGFVLEGWMTKYFPTEEMARVEAERIIEKHKKQLIEAGLKVEYYGEASV